MSINNGYNMRMYPNSKKEEIKKCIPITGDTILNRIPCIQVYTNKDYNKKLQEYHQQLLTEAMHRNDYKYGEILMLINIVTDKYIKLRGDFHHVTIINNKDWNTMVNVSAKNSLIVIHNHPNGSRFSYADIITFSQYNSILNMTAISNNGNIYYLEKKPNFYPNKIIKYMGNTNNITDENIKSKYVLDNSNKFNLIFKTSKRRI